MQINMHINTHAQTHKNNKTKTMQSTKSKA